MGRLLESLKGTGKRIKELVDNFVKPGNEIGGLSLADGEDGDLSKFNIDEGTLKVLEESRKAMDSFEKRLAYIPEEHQKTFKANKQVSNSQEGKAPITQTQPEKDGIER